MQLIHYSQVFESIQNGFHPLWDPAIEGMVTTRLNEIYLF
jgi:hypothetical protein